MPRSKNKKEEVVVEVDQFKLDFERVLSFKYNKQGAVIGVLIGGRTQDDATLMNLKAEASAMKTFILFDIMENTIANEAARYSLETAKTLEELQFAKALAAINKMFCENVRKLAAQALG